MAPAEKVIVVTRAARGLGRTDARRFAKLGNNPVVLCDRRDCAETVARREKAGGGSIINISALAAVYGMPNGLHYTTRKPPSSPSPGALRGRSVGSISAQTRWRPTLYTRKQPASSSATGK